MEDFLTAEDAREFRTGFLNYYDQELQRSWQKPKLRTRICKGRPFFHIPESRQAQWSWGVPMCTRNPDKCRQRDIADAPVGKVNVKWMCDQLPRGDGAFGSNFTDRLIAYEMMYGLRWGDAADRAGGFTVATMSPEATMEMEALDEGIQDELDAGYYTANSNFSFFPGSYIRIGVVDKGRKRVTSNFSFPRNE